MSPVLHTLTIHPPDDTDLRYTLTCHAGTEPDRDCVLYEMCGCEPTDPDDPDSDNQPCPASPTGHRWMAAPAWLAVPTTQCWVRDGDNTRDAVQDLALPPGTYLVAWTSDGDENEYIILSVVSGVVV